MSKGVYVVVVKCRRSQRPSNHPKPTYTSSFCVCDRRIDSPYIGQKLTPESHCSVLLLHITGCVWVGGG